MIAEQIQAILSVKSGTWGAEFAKADKQLSGFQKHAQTVSQGLAKTGKSMTVGVTVPILAGATAAVMAAKDFETAMTGVQKTTGATEDQMKPLGDAVRQTAIDFGQSSTEIARTMQNAAQLGVKGQGGLTKFTRAMTLLSETTDYSANEAATEIAKFSNAFGVAGKRLGRNAERVGDTITSLGNQFGATEPEIMSMAQRMSSTGRIVGATQSGILGLATSLTEAGVNAEAGGTAMSKSLTQINSAVIGGGKKLQTYARISGMSASKFKQAWKQDATGALITFTEGLGKFAASGRNADKLLGKLGITSVRQKDALLALANNTKKAAAAQKIANDQFKNGGAAADEWKNRADDLDVQLGQLREQARDVGIDVGSALVPALKEGLIAAQPLIDTVKDLAKSFSEAEPSTQQLIIKIAAIAAVAGPAMWATSKLINSIRMIASGTKAAISGITWLIQKLMGQRAATVAQTAANQGLAASNNQVASSSTRAGNAMRGIGKAAGVMGIAATATQLVRDQVYGMVSPTVEATQMMEQLSSAVQGTSTQLGSFGTNIDTAFGQVGVGLGNVGEEVSKQAPLWRQWIRTANPIGKNFAEWGQGIQFFTQRTQQSNDEIANLDQSMAQLVSNGSVDQARAMYEKFGQQTVEAGGSLEQLAAAFPAYNEAIKAAGESANTAAQQQNAYATAVQQTNLIDKALQAEQFRSTLQMLNAQVADGAGKWNQISSALYSAAGAQSRQRDMAVQAAGDNQQAIDQANAAYQRQAVKLGQVAVKAGAPKKALQTLAQSAGMSAGQFQRAINQMANKGKSAGQAVAAAISSGKPRANAASKSLGAGVAEQLARSLMQGQSKARNAGKRAADGAGQGVKASNAKNQARQMGTQTGAQLAQSLASKIGAARSAGSNVANGAKSGIAGANLGAAGQSAGQAAGSGLVSGLQSMAGSVMSTAASIANAASSAIRSALSINSPSRVWKKIGGHTVKGFIAGISKGKKGIKKPVKELAREASANFEKAMRKRVKNMKAAVQLANATKQSIVSFGSLAEVDTSGVAAAEEYVKAAGKVAALQAEMIAADAAGDRYALADAMLRETSALEAQAQAYDKLTDAQKASVDAGRMPSTGAAAFLDDMESRVVAAEDFQKTMAALNGKLRNDVWQGIAAKGPGEGSAIADAILAGGQSAIRRANNLQSRLVRAGSGLGDEASKSLSGRTKAQAQAVIDSSVTVKELKVTVNANGATPRDRVAIERAAKRAVIEAMKELEREAKAKRK